VADVMMPRLGVSVTEGTLSAWLKQVGDTVEVGEAICEVSTDKVDTEIESTASGVLTEQLFAEGETVPVGEPLARVGGAEESPGAPAAPAADETAPDQTAPDETAPEQTAPPEAEASQSSEPPAAPASPPDGAASAPAQLVLMPQMGVSVTEGTLSTWLKQVGETVEVGEPLCEVSTDKVDTEIESTAAGVVLEHRHAEGDVVPVGEALAVVGTPGAASGEPSAVAPSSSEPPPGDEPPPGHARPLVEARPGPASDPARSGRPAELRPGPFDHRAMLGDMLARGAGVDRVMASPAARALAAELEVDLAEARGTGSGGHVTREDVQNLKAGHPVPTGATARPQDRAPAPAAERRPAPAEASTEPPSGMPAGYEDVPHEVVGTSRIRRVTAEHMSRSRRTAAHMTTEVDVDLGRLTEVRQQLNLERAQQGLSKLSFLPFVARAACAALKDHPSLNATFRTEELYLWRQVNLGIAVDTPRGLMVPVVHGAERLTVEPLADAIVAAAARVREGKAGPDDFRAGTFTISNPGSVGAVSAPAIINQPQVGILGMPTIVRRPWVVRLADGQETIAIRPIIRLALTFDHRAVDGADATRCLVDVGKHLESWQVGDYR